MQEATEYYDSVHLRVRFTCLIRDRKGSLGTTTTEYYDEVRLIRDHNGSLNKITIKYYWKNSMNNIIWITCKLFVHHFVLRSEISEI